MRWPEKEPLYAGKARNRKGFLFFPKKLMGETRWLEWAHWIDVCEEINDYDPDSDTSEKKIVWRGFCWNDNFGGRRTAAKDH
jgi:hypothetical protein